MPVEITIVGMNRIAASIGLALANQKHQLRLTGVDRDLKKTQQAHKLGALDATATNLEKAVQGADLVILCLPLAEMETNLQIILPALKTEAVVLDTSVIQEPIFQWAQALLPAGRYYLSLSPTLNPAFLADHSTRLEDANADLFKDGLCIISSLPKTSEAALKLAVDFASLLGARPYFAEPCEVDGLLGMVNLLPRLTSAALAQAALAQPGWPEARKLAGPAFAAVTAALELDEGCEALGSEAVANRENAIRLLNALIYSLQDLSAQIAAGDAEALQKRLNEIRAGREAWLNQRHSGNWEEQPKTELPTKGGVLLSLLGLGRKPKTEG